MGLGRLLEACRVHEKVALEHSSKSTKYELEGSYDDLVHEHFHFFMSFSVQLGLNGNRGYQKPTRPELMEK